MAKGKLQRAAVLGDDCAVFAENSGALFHAQQYCDIVFCGNCFDSLNRMLDAVAVAFQDFPTQHRGQLLVQQTRTQPVRHILVMQRNRKTVCKAQRLNIDNRLSLL